jgi:hypothetical protein
VAWLAEPPAAVAPAGGAVLPIPEAALPAEVVQYQPTRLSSWRPEGGMIYGGGTSGGVAGRAAVLFADFLRDQALLLDLTVLGSFDYTQGLALYQNRAGRVPWSVGAFHFVQLQIDREDPFLEYLQRDFGLVGALSFPLDRYRRLETELTLGGTERSCLTDLGGTSLYPCGGYQVGRDGGAASTDQLTAAWRSLNGGVQATVSPVLRYGHDTVRHDPITGPLDGSAALLELGGGWVPSRQALHGFARAELSRWWSLVGRSNVMLRLAAATSFAGDEAGRRWQRTWWLSSADNLRGYTPYDLDYLLGRSYYVANLELQVPLDGVIRLPLFDQIEGVAALDFGGVFNRHETVRQGTAPDGATCLFSTTRRPAECLEPGAWDVRTFTGVLGINVLLGPILLRLHWGHPFDVGGLRTPALRLGDRWVTNLTLRYAFF